MRIELTTTAWEAVVLPLNYTCVFAKIIFHKNLFILQQIVLKYKNVFNNFNLIFYNTPYKSIPKPAETKISIIGEIAFIIALFSKVEWKPIPHGSNVKITDLANISQDDKAKSNASAEQSTIL